MPNTKHDGNPRLQLKPLEILIIPQPDAALFGTASFGMVLGAPEDVTMSLLLDGVRTEHLITVLTKSLADAHALVEAAKRRRG